MDEGRNMILLFPTLIDFESKEDRKNFDVSCHMFYTRRVLDVKDGKPKWSGINEGEGSKLMDDEGEQVLETNGNIEKKRKREDEELGSEEFSSKE